jgi:hypothetical protein
MGSRLQSNETPPAAKVDTLMLGPNFSQLPNHETSGVLSQSSTRFSDIQPPRAGGLKCAPFSVDKSVPFRCLDKRCVTSMIGNSQGKTEISLDLAE